MKAIINIDIDFELTSPIRFKGISASTDIEGSNTNIKNYGIRVHEQDYKNLDYQFDPIKCYYEIIEKILNFLDNNCNYVSVNFNSSVDDFLIKSGEYFLQKVNVDTFEFLSDSSENENYFYILINNEIENFTQYKNYIHGSQ